MIVLLCLSVHALFVHKMLNPQVEVSAVGAGEEDETMLSKILSQMALVVVAYCSQQLKPDDWHWVIDRCFVHLLFDCVV